LALSGGHKLTNKYCDRTQSRRKEEKNTFNSYRLSNSSSSAVRSRGLILLNGSLVFRGTLPGLPLSLDIGSDDCVVAVTTAVPLVDMRLLLVGLGELVSDNGAEGGGGVGSEVFGLVATSSSEDESESESELDSDELEESETSFLTALAFFALLLTSTFTSSSLSLSLESHDFFFPFLVTNLFSIVFASTSLELELSVLSAGLIFFAATLSLSEIESASESDALLEPNVLLDWSGEGCFFGIFFFVMDFFEDAVEATAMTFSVVLVSPVK
jgi:hypothetical protein